MFFSLSQPVCFLLTLLGMVSGLIVLMWRINTPLKAKELYLRTRSWWWMLCVLLLAFSFGSWGLILLWVGLAAIAGI